MNIPICILTSDDYMWMLRPFAFLFNTFWSHKQEVTVFGYTPVYKILNDLPPNFTFVSISKRPYPVERWSDGLIEMIHKLNAWNFILFLEDFWLYQPVKLDVVEILCEYAELYNDILRIDLTNERISKRNAKIVENFNGVRIVDAGLPSPYSMSFQAGIWNRDLALEVLAKGETPWKAEINGTERVNGMEGKLRVLGSDKKPVEYQPVYRNHKRSLSIDKIPVQLLNVITQNGWLTG
jgi:hypothetical protein